MGAGVCFLHLHTWTSVLLLRDNASPGLPPVWRPLGIREPPEGDPAQAAKLDFPGTCSGLCGALS